MPSFLRTSFKIAAYTAGGLMAIALYRDAAYFKYEAHKLMQQDHIMIMMLEDRRKLTEKCGRADYAAYKKLGVYNGVLSFRGPLKHHFEDSFKWQKLPGDALSTISEFLLTPVNAVAGYYGAEAGFSKFCTNVGNALSQKNATP